MRGKTAIVLMVAVCVVAAGVVQAADWKKVGSTTWVFKDAQLDVKAKKSAPACSQIRLRSSGEMVKVSKIKITFADGSTQDVAFNGVLRSGVFSDPIDIDGGPKTIAQIQVSHIMEGARAALRTQLTIQGTT
jgi:hypothetical protein